MAAEPYRIFSIDEQRPQKPAAEVRSSLALDLHAFSRRGRWHDQPERIAKAAGVPVAKVRRLSDFAQNGAEGAFDDFTLGELARILDVVAGADFAQLVRATSPAARLRVKVELGVATTVELRAAGILVDPPKPPEPEPEPPTLEERLAVLETATGRHERIIEARSLGMPSIR